MVLGQSWSLSLAFRSAGELSFQCASLRLKTHQPSPDDRWELIGKAVSWVGNPTPSLKAVSGEISITKNPRSQLFFTKSTFKRANTVNFLTRYSLLCICYLGLHPILSSYLDKTIDLVSLLLPSRVEIAQLLLFFCKALVHLIFLKIKPKEQKINKQNLTP